MTTICSKGQKLKSSFFNVHKLHTDDNLVCSSFSIGSISAVSRVRSLILPEERGDECGLIFPNSGW